MSQVKVEMGRNIPKDGLFTPVPASCHGEDWSFCWTLVISEALNIPNNEKISWLWEGKLSEFIRLFRTVPLYSRCNGEKHQLLSFPVNNTKIVVLESALIKASFSSPSWLSLHPRVSKVPVLHNSLWPMKGSNGYIGVSLSLFHEGQYFCSTK